MKMIDRLDRVLKILPEKILGPIDIWDSLIVNRRKPHTYRVFTMIDGLRVCLHRFEMCSPEDAFEHPHPWPGAFWVAAGHYRQRVSYAPSRQDKPRREAMDMILSPGAKYSITNPLTWHSVQPLVVEGYLPPKCTDIYPPSAFSVMVNDSPWPKDAAHAAAPTTAGKDLDKMTLEDLELHLRTFHQLLLVA
jgi:hypothetical protein